MENANIIKVIENTLAPIAHHGITVDVGSQGEVLVSFSWLYSSDRGAKRLNEILENIHEELGKHGLGLYPLPEAPDEPVLCVNSITRFVSEIETV